MSDSDISKLMVGITMGCYILVMTLSVISLLISESDMFL